MPRPWLGLAAAVVFWPLSPAVAQQDRGVELVPGHAESRWALVVGNAAYAGGELRNPLNDARGMAEVLRELRFDVDLREDLDHQAMEDAIRAFGRKLRTGGVGVFYFAGHGVQVDGRNYLIPVGTRIGEETELKYKAVDLGFLLDQMGEAHNRLNIVILDACRDNPFRSFRTLSRGLAQTEAPTGTFIAFATAPGKVAADGTGRHGVFTEHLLAVLRLPGLKIEEVFKQTRQAVVGTTGRAQVPWTASSLVGEFVPRPGISELPPMPSGTSFSLEDLRTQATIEAARKAWADSLTEMKVAFTETERFAEGPVSPGLKVQAWQRFLSAFAEENPYSEEDDSLRTRAQARLTEGQRGANVALEETIETPGAADGHAYVGNKNCKKCHLKQFKSWAETAMAKTFDTLKPGAAAEAKKAAGLDPYKDYSTDPHCLGCHTVGYGKKGGFVDIATTPNHVGAGCEMCHGPGGTYVQVQYMSLKNKEYKKADLVAVGLVDKVGEAQCVFCHNHKSPTRGELDYATEGQEGIHELFPLRYYH
ncbi:MAG: hypothetical protein GY856_42155 [bacterium]|nr:hypothetical protein [bacterium]